jgi:BlaI family penicillinase repressor
MTHKRRLPMSDAEQQVLKALWEHGPGSVREIHAFLNEHGMTWSRSTVITLLQRLEKKRYVSSDKSAHAFVFRAAVTREQVGTQRLMELAEELYEGDPAPLVLAFAEKHRFTQQQIQEFREWIDQLTPKERKRKPGK